MFNITKESIQWGGRTLTLESGRLARQADGAVLVTYGETQVLCTVVGAKEDKPGQDFFPLSVDVEGPLGSICEPLAYGAYTSEHHCQTLPTMSVKPKAFR
jgi:hypothetical protein